MEMTVRDATRWRRDARVMKSREMVMFLQALQNFRPNSGLTPVGGAHHAVARSGCALFASSHAHAPFQPDDRSRSSS
jgi:hypothetical protein